jgi:prevent-host-death family protein
MRDHVRLRRTVGVRELKARAAAILRQVREDQATYVVTHRGQPVGVIMPIDAHDAAEEQAASKGWDAFLRSGRRLEQAFRPGRGGVEALSSTRR